MKASCAILSVVAGFFLTEATAVTIHRSFGSRSVGFGGGIGCDVSVEAKVAAAVDEARAKEAERAKVYVGRVTSVSSGDTICLVTDGGTRVPVRLEGIVAPPPGLPAGKASAGFLRKMVQGRQVRVEYRKRDKQGRVLGRVTLNKTDVAQKMIAEGMAKPAETVGRERTERFGVD